MHELLNNPEVQRLLAPDTGLLFAVWETMYMTVVSTLFAYVIGLPLGVLMVAGEEGGVMPLPRPVMTVLNFIINILRSVPFLILMVLVIPLSRLIIGTSIGTVATIIPLIVAAFPFVARLVEASIREVDKGVVEAAQSMGCSPFQIISKVMIPESRPSLISGFTTAFITILSYGAMAGAIGGGGLGDFIYHGPQPGLPAAHVYRSLCGGHRPGGAGADLPVRGHPHGGPSGQAHHAQGEKARTQGGREKDQK